MNAYQSFESNSGEITVQIKPSSDSVEIVIKDTGIGIDPDYIKEIFDPFFTKKPKGTGLGLTICNEFITLHNGTIRVESKMHEGTQVYVMLPRKKEAS